MADPLEHAKFITFHSYDDYTTNLPLDAILDDDVLLALNLTTSPCQNSTADLSGLLCRNDMHGRVRNGSNRLSCIMKIVQAFGKKGVTTTTLTHGLNRGILNKYEYFLFYFLM